MRFKAMKITFFGETLKKRKVGSKLWIVAKTEAVAVSSGIQVIHSARNHFFVFAKK